MIAEHAHHVLAGFALSRISPWSTNTQVKLVANRLMNQQRPPPKLSTPPESPHSTRPLPHLLRGCALDRFAA